MTEEVRVMVVDDSAVIRGFTRRFLEEDERIKVVQSASNGKQAVDSLKPDEIDVIILDIEMPVMDGLTALPQLIEIDSRVKIIMSSTLTTSNARVTLDALASGAADCIAKPTSTGDISDTAGGFKQELVAKTLALGRTARLAAPKTAATKSTPRKAAPIAPLQPKTEPVLRPRAYRGVAKALAIGSSTGGPQALMAFLTDLPKLDIPIFITQHMPATFTKILADNLSDKTGKTCIEASDGMIVKPGEVYIAPGNYHMEIEGTALSSKIKLTQEPPENFCRPSVEPMMRSLIDIYGDTLVGVILTGMGKDGVGACEQLVNSKGNVIAQDEETSVVWGMPGAVAQAGLCCKIEPLGNMASTVHSFIKGN